MILGRLLQLDGALVLTPRGRRRGRRMRNRRTACPWITRGRCRGTRMCPFTLDRGHARSSGTFLACDWRLRNRSCREIFHTRLHTCLVGYYNVGKGWGKLFPRTRKRLLWQRSVGWRPWSIFISRRRRAHCMLLVLLRDPLAPWDRHIFSFGGFRSARKCRCDMDSWWSSGLRSALHDRLPSTRV